MMEKSDKDDNEINLDNVRQPLIDKTNEANPYDSLPINNKNSIDSEYMVYINKPEAHQVTETNKISTSKYSWYNVVPKVLIEQFSKMANIYFLIIAIGQSIHEISISAGKPVILLPLSVVIFVNGLKDFFEDWKRKSSDDEENKKKVKILNTRNGVFEEKTWADVKLGNILKVNENESFPADMILLNSSDENGLCYKETKNLDGETNLKFRQANAKISEILNTNTYFEKLNGIVQCKPPNEFIYQFDAVIKLNNSHELIFVDKNSFLLRGCSLRQTAYIYGLVVYVGHNTKIMKNSPSARSKTSKIENIMNFQILIIFCMQICLSLIGSIFYMIWYSNAFNDLHNYIFTKENVQHIDYISMLFSRLGTWILIFTNLVPISLLVTMEMVKYIQGMFISWDIEIFDKERKLPAKVQTSTLNEELGQVKYIFSDKTGTLTQNYMEYCRMSIGNYTYGVKEHHHSPELNDKFGTITNVNFKDEFDIDKSFKMHMDDIKHDNYKNIRLFLECLSLCHSVMIDVKADKDKLIYQAASPDELCLVNAARYFGYIFKGRDINNKIFLNINGNEEEYTLLNFLEYSSERKKMSVIVKCPDGKIRIYTKGADSVIREKISINKELVDVNENHLSEFAQEGLRTLMIAFREISENEYNTWKNEYNKVISDPVNKEQNLPKVFEMIENNFYLIGATAIEDKLQYEVGETLSCLIDAGIKVWMLTGDKMDTAKSIAYSCKLISNQFVNLEIREKISSNSIGQLITGRLKFIEQNPDHQYSLIISTEELSKIMSNEYLKDAFYHLVIRCQAVVCCRVTPKQKAQMVHLIKDREESNTTLAIGDGANDVNMITSAHIGVGIVGVEGTQAARSSDYSISQFCYLRRLLLVHGRESYRKNSFIVCYNFYKNVLFVMPQFWFGHVSLYSGQTLYDPWIYQLFNIMFASIPIIWFGIYDQEVSYDELYKQPKYYTQGIVGKLFHSIRFWKWVFSGIFQAFIVYLLGYYCLDSPRHDGKINDLWSIGSMIYSCIVIVVNLKIFFSTNNHSIISFMLFFLSILCYWIVLSIMSLYFRFENFNNFYMLLSDGWYYLASFAACVLIVTLDSGLTHLFYKLGVIKDGRSIEPGKIDEHLKNKIRETNKEIEQLMTKRYSGEAFSQERGQVPNLLKK